jgi:ABC-2 type transport system permease protein
MWTIAQRSWRDHWKGILAWIGGLVGIAVVQLSVYPSVRDTAVSTMDFVNAFPEAFKAMFRISDYTSGPGYLSVELFSMLVPLVFIAVGASWGSAATAGEEESGTADLLIALPISRTRVILAKMAATAALILVLGALLVATLAIGSRILDMQVPVERIAAATAASALLGLLFSGIGFLIGAWSGRRAAALGVSIGLAIGGYLLFSLAPLADTLERTLPFNPFQWSIGSDALMDGWNADYLLRLSAVSLVLLAAAVLAFRRRDIGT